MTDKLKGKWIGDDISRVEQEIMSEEKWEEMDIRGQIQQEVPYKKCHNCGEFKVTRTKILSELFSKEKLYVSKYFCKNCHWSGSYD